MSTEGSGLRIAVIGSISAIICAFGTLYFLVSVFLYPIWAFLFFLALRWYRRTPAPGSILADYGLALAVSALLMPLAAGVGYVFYSIQDHDPTFVSSEPFYYAVYTPAAVALVLPILIAAYRRRADRSGRERIAT